MARKRYDPADDPVVKKFLEAKSSAERRAIEREAVVQSENGPKETDPKRRRKKS